MKMEEITKDDIIVDYAKQMFNIFMEHRGHASAGDLLVKARRVKRSLIKKRPGDVTFITDAFRIVAEVSKTMELERIYTVEEIIADYYKRKNEGLIT